MKNEKMRTLPEATFKNLPDAYGGSTEFKNESFDMQTIKAVLRIRTEFGLTSAFLISPDGYALTCAHAITESGNVSKVAEKLKFVYFMGATPIKAGTFEIVNIKPDIDLALIKVTLDGIEKLPYLKLASEDRLIGWRENYFIPEYSNKDASKSFMLGFVHSECVKDEYGCLYYLDGGKSVRSSGVPVISEKDGCVIGIVQGLDLTAEYLRVRPTTYFWKEFLE